MACRGWSAADTPPRRVCEGAMQKYKIQRKRAGGDEQQDRLLKVHRRVVTRYTSGGLSDTKMADIVERDILPEWQALRERFVALKNGATLQQTSVAKLTEYLFLREE